MDTQTPTTTPADTVLLAWSAPSHFHHERSPRWYLTASIIVLAIAAYGILSGAWSVALVSLLIGGVYFITRHEKPSVKSIRIERDGVQYEDLFAPWKDCKEFWMVKTPLYTELHILRASGFRREIIMQTGDIDPAQIRSTLSQFVLMKADQRERLLDALVRMCKL